jgi:hypothetical protein
LDLIYDLFVPGSYELSKSAGYELTSELQTLSSDKRMNVFLYATEVNGKDRVYYSCQESPSHAISPSTMELNKSSKCPNKKISLNSEQQHPGSILLKPKRDITVHVFVHLDTMERN